MISELTICFNRLVLELTPLQRLDAMRKLSSDSKQNPWYTVIGIAAIVILTLLLILVNRRQKKSQQESSHKVFAKMADKHGLTQRECDLLWNIAVKAKLQRNESIFTLPTAFNRSEMKFLQEQLVEYGSEHCDHLQIELSFLREKLGFDKTLPSNQSYSTEPDTLSSRQIPTGKKLYIRHHRSTNPGDLESVVIKNSPNEITVQFNMPVEITFGQTWRCRYYSGASLWEFDTTVNSSSGHVVALKHSDDIRLINRRRFLRVPTKHRAVIAPLPFSKRSAYDGPWPRKKTDVIEDISHKPIDLLCAPEFTAATVTELGGTGLRVSADIRVAVNDRVLILFQLNASKSIHTIPTQMFQPFTDNRVLTSTAVVRHIKSLGENGLSLALELTGLTDEEIDELIRITNELSIHTKKMEQLVPAMESV